MYKDFINYFYALIVTLIIGYMSMLLASKFTKNQIVEVSTRPIYILVAAALLDWFMFYR